MSSSLSALIAGQFLLETSERNNLVKFKNRERCLESVFWTVHDRMDSGKKTILVMDKKEDIEYIFYKLSKSGVQPLSLYLQDGKQLLADKLTERFREDESNLSQRRPTARDNDGARKQLSAIIQEMETDISRLRIPHLGSLSLSEVQDQLSSSLAHRIETSDQILKPPYLYKDYQRRKTTFENIQKIYDTSFRFLSASNPINEETILKVARPSLKSMLQELMDESRALDKRYLEIEKLVFKEIESTRKDELDKIKHQMTIVGTMLKRNSELSDTELKKQLFHQKELFASLSVVGDLPERVEDLEMGMARIQEAANDHLSSHYSMIQEEGNRQLSMLTPAQGKYPELGQLIADTNAYINKVNELDIFNHRMSKKSIAFLYQHNNLKELQQQIAHAIFFVSEHEQYFQWLEAEADLSEEEKSIVGHLSKQDKFWGEAFEELFLSYFVEHSKATLGSVNARYNDLNEALGKYSSDYGDSIISKWGSNDISVPPLIGDWNNFLDDHSKSLHNIYPLIIVSSEFYRSYGERLVHATEQFVFVDHLPETLFEEDWFRNIIVGYDDNFMNGIKNRVKGISPAAIRDVKHSFFSINNQMEHLPVGERVKAASYLGQEMKSMTAPFKIYQTKQISIISFWSEMKNALLLQHMEGSGMKEIMSDSPEMNLIPALLIDLDRKTFVLIEDDIFSVREDLDLIRHHKLLEELKTAGVYIISIDNYKSIMRGEGHIVGKLEELRMADYQMEPALV